MCGYNNLGPSWIDLFDGPNYTVQDSNVYYKFSCYNDH